MHNHVAGLTITGVEITKYFSLFLPVRLYLCLSSTSRQRVISKILAFPSEKCLKFLLVRFYFYLSQTGGQPVISIPAIMDELWDEHYDFAFIVFIVFIADGETDGP